MSLWSRIANAFRSDRLSREIDEELQSHLAEAIEQGRDPSEARMAFGSTLVRSEESRDLRLIQWLDSLRADSVFGLRQLKKRKATSAAAILSLALAIGACTSAFRLIDALLLRPLPVANPERLYSLVRQEIAADGSPRLDESYEYPLFLRLRAAVKDQAKLMAISPARAMELTFGQDKDVERVYLQYVSGLMFPAFGLRPALGRLFTENDDLEPGAHPYAVLSHDFWTRRFAEDPKVIGRTFRMGKVVYEIVGVAEKRFTGTEPGTVVGVFLPAIMHPDARRAWSGWCRTLVQLKPGMAAEPTLDRLRATYRASVAETAKGFPGTSKQRLEQFLNGTLLLEPAASGVSRLQKQYRLALAILGGLVALVLLIACANVANLMTAQAAARVREMALRISIGAGSWRLVQLVLVESAWLAFLSAAIGGLFAWWSAPFVVSLINPPSYAARLVLPLDWRILGFSLALTLVVTCLFGLAPALRASAIKPASVLKGGDDPHSRRRMMLALIGVQVAFCFLVHFVSGLFVSTSNRLVNRPTGFSTDRLLTLAVSADPAQPAPFWDQVADRLRAVPGVEKVALASFPLLSGSHWNHFISIGGAPPSDEQVHFLNVSPGWTDAMKIPLLGGRDFETSDASGVALVNHAFATRYFGSGGAIGKSFDKVEANGRRTRLEIVGLIGDTRYNDMREPFKPTVYEPFRSSPATSGGTFLLRTASSSPLGLASILRNEVARARPGFRANDIQTQEELNLFYTVRERLLAMLSLFFAGVALLLAGVGLYGVLDYTVIGRRREIGIRMAIGAQSGDIAWRVTVDVFSMVVVGAIAGLALGMASVRYIESLLYGVKATDISILALPPLAILAAAILAALPAVIRALRIDPAKMLRAD